MGTLIEIVNHSYDTGYRKTKSIYRKQKLRRHLEAAGKVSVFANIVEALRGMSADVNYDCRIENGVCKRHSLPYTCADGRLCCYNCVRTFGYQDYIYSRRHLDCLKDNYSKKTGFWRKDDGCVLPRKYRSDTCLSHRCDHFDGNRVERPTRELVLLSMFSASREAVIGIYLRMKKMQTKNIKTGIETILDTDSKQIADRSYLINMYNWRLFLLQGD